MKWKHIKRILYWPESKYEIESILAKRRTRLWFYEFKENMREICKQTKCDENFYKTVKDYELKGTYFYYVERHFPATAFMMKFENDVNIYRKMEAFVNYFGAGNWLLYFNDDSFLELWQLFKNAPFWKDYAVWKKLHIMLDDF